MFKRKTLIKRLSFFFEKRTAQYGKTLVLSFQTCVFDRKENCEIDSNYATTAQESAEKKFLLSYIQLRCLRMVICDTLKFVFLLAKASNMH